MYINTLKGASPVINLGISTYSLTWSIGVPGYEPPAQPLTAFDLLKKANVQQIGIVQFADNLPLHHLRPGELAELKEAADRMNIRIEVGTRGTEPEHLLQYLDIAQVLDAVIVRTLITAHDLTEAKQQILKVLPKFEAAGVALAVENHGLHTTRQLAMLFDEISHPLVGCCLDTVNSFSALDSPETVIRDLTPYILNLHVKDFDIKRIDHQMGFVILGTAAGYGKLNIQELIETLKRHNKSPNAILELWTPYMGNIEETIRLENEWFEQSISYLKGLNIR